MKVGEQLALSPTPLADEFDGLVDGAIAGAAIIPCLPAAAAGSEPRWRNLYGEAEPDRRPRRVAEHPPTVPGGLPVFCDWLASELGRPPLQATWMPT